MYSEQTPAPRPPKGERGLIAPKHYHGPAPTCDSNVRPVPIRYLNDGGPVAQVQRAVGSRPRCLNIDFHPLPLPRPRPDEEERLGVLHTSWLDAVLKSLRSERSKVTCEEVKQRLHGSHARGGEGAAALGPPRRLPILFFTLALVALIKLREGHVARRLKAREGGAVRRPWG